MLPGILSRIQRRLEQGSKLPLIGLRVRLHVERSAGAKSAEHEVFRNVLRRLIALFPELARFAHASAESDVATCTATLAFMHDYLPLFHAPARETQLRRLLTQLRSQVPDEGYRQQLTLEIARSDLRSGIPERATVLLRERATTPEERELVRTLEEEIARFERHYGARAGLIPNLEVWRSIPGDVRGQSLVAYFEANRALVAGKSILHVAPEEALRSWFEREAPASGVRYATLDPFLSSVDLREDLTALRLGDASFDLVICHRVLEHVLDDAAALGEMYRVLKPGGVLNLSVPQSVNRDTTNEWVIPDYSHDHHVRQYGNDLEERLHRAGFREVVVERFLLDRTREQHVAEGTYPLRILLCSKPR